MSSKNVCEHGDHPAPEGQRFCSDVCARCEHESKGKNGCDDICKEPPKPPKQKRGFALMDPARRLAFAKQGGKKAHDMGKRHTFTPEEAKAAGRKGGKAAKRPRTKPLGTAASSEPSPES